MVNGPRRPIASASLLWNGLMLWAGIFASHNVGRLLDLLGRANVWLVAVTLVISGGLVYWWVRSRREHEDDEDSREHEEEGADLSQNGTAEGEASDGTDGNE